MLAFNGLYVYSDTSYFYFLYSLSKYVFYLAPADRAAFFAGFIDGDGSYDPSNDRYILYQGKQKLKLLEDYRRLGIGLGLRCSPIVPDVQDKYKFGVTGPECNIFTPYLRHSNKVQDRRRQVNYENSNYKWFKIKKHTGEAKEFINIEVEGNFFQLSDGTLAHDSR